MTDLTIVKQNAFKKMFSFLDELDNSAIRFFSISIQK